MLDEGHLARTDTTKILKSLRKVHTKRRVLLSGTPFHNNFQEFYTTLELVRLNFMQKANPEMKRTLNALIGDINLSHETINHDIITNAFCQLRNPKIFSHHHGQHANPTRPKLHKLPKQPIHSPVRNPKVKVNSYFKPKMRPKNSRPQTCTELQCSCQKPSLMH